MTEVNAMLPSIERSMLPIKMMNVSPNAMMINIELWRARLARLMGLKKRGLMIVITKTSTISTIKGPRMGGNRNLRKLLNLWVDSSVTEATFCSSISTGGMTNN